jgi:putative hydrolase
MARGEKIGLRHIALAEHVRRTSDWIPKYLAETRAENAIASSSKLKLITGFEAKILRYESIDCCEEDSRSHFIVASFHTIFEDKRIWIEALKNAIQNPDVDVIGHLVPESTFDLDDHELSELASINIKTYRKMFCMRYWNEVYTYVCLPMKTQLPKARQEKTRMTLS